MSLAEGDPNTGANRGASGGRTFERRNPANGVATCAVEVTLSGWSAWPHRPSCGAHQGDGRTGKRGMGVYGSSTQKTWGRLMPRAPEQLPNLRSTNDRERRIGSVEGGPMDSTREPTRERNAVGPLRGQG